MMEYLQTLLPTGSQLVFKGLAPHWALLVMLGLWVVAATTAWLQVGSPRSGPRVLSLVLRMLLALLLAGVLTGPVLRMTKHMPQESYLIHLYDTSGSMGITDMNGTGRLAATRLATRSGTPTREELKRTYRELTFSFDESLLLRDDNSDITAGDKATDLRSAFQDLAAQTRGLPISGVVLYTDGNPTLNEQPSAVIDAAAQLNAPVYTIGSGPQVPAPDVWVEKINAPDEINVQVETQIRAVIGTRGMAGRNVEAVLRVDGVEKERHPIQINQNQQDLVAEFNLHPEEEGMLNCEVALEHADGESYPWNDKEPFFIQVQKKKFSLLYLEGHPRYEYRFLRTAFESDARFRVVSAVHLGQDHPVFRQGIGSSSELEQGFPASRAELFSYDVVVLGDMAAENFTPDQLKDLHDFVSVRGGGLLLLAGEQSFAPNGYGKTPLADVLPFFPDQAALINSELQVTPAEYGREHTLFGPYDPQVDHQAPWSVLPPLKGLYSLGQLKPGVVNVCEVDLVGQKLPVVAFQRFGKGVSLVCGLSATWPWKLEVPSDNTAFSAFWKEMMLILGERSERKIEADVQPRIATLGSEVTARGRVVDENFKTDPAARVTMELEEPDGTKRPIDADATVEHGYTFSSKIKPAKGGLYKVRVSTVRGDATTSVSTKQALFFVRDDPPERREVRLNEGLMREIAQASGGAYLPVSQYDQLPQLIKPREGTRQKVDERSLYDRAMMLWLMLGLLAADWSIRRFGNMA